ncbi:carbon-nitrogen family hydrolase [Desulforhopalus singaporensis]|uniref:Carbon-nitrogen hydrolase n=1 Tax=Desulforhopalus singaporensis TaxID=91360 RepID=A0A1H0RSE6_9BACT|nr:carbon-nitrogen family hydrolase [Desulforhopalus singaporensis]SDP32434.1 Carbon-nitrogen hydrolase [Desulforhopalus singaporensis]
MKVASIQLAVVENDKEKTLEKAAIAVESCSDADLIILPEIWNIGFMSFDRYVGEAEELDGPTVTLMSGLAKKKGAYIHTGSFVENRNGRYYNTSLLLSPEGAIVAEYRKIHLFGYNSRETQLLTPGTEVAVAKTVFGNLGLATCFDLRFPELFRAMVDKGADMFLVCSAWPFPRLEAWSMLNRVRALENQCYLISANSAGLNGGSQFVGHSMVVDPWGTVLAGAGDQEMIVRTEIDTQAVAEARDTFPGLAGRRDFLNKCAC